MSAVRVCGSANFKGCFSFKPAPPRRLRFQPCRIAEKNTPSEGLENSVEGTKSPKKEDEISEVLGEDVHKALERSGGQEIHLSQGSFESLDSRLHQLLPDHSPGEFPDTHLHPSGWAGSTEDEEPDFDPLRDGPLRYLGYANELGEAFGAWLPPGGVPLSYGIAISYVLVDTYDKGMAAKRESAEQLERKSAAIPESVDRERLSSILAAERALDTVVWQLLASVIFPGFTIHQVVAATHSFLHPHLEHLTPREMEQMSAMAGYLHFGTNFLINTVDRTIPTMMGLLAIPFIVHPIDNGVHLLLDKTLRPKMRELICNNMQGCEAGLDMCAVPERSSATKGK